MNWIAAYDALNLYATAIDEADSGRSSLAMTAWLEAGIAASRAFDPGTKGAEALSVIRDYASPSRAWESHRAPMWRSLDNASLACLLAGRGDAEASFGYLLDAFRYAVSLPCTAALAGILTIIRESSRTGVTV